MNRLLLCTLLLVSCGQKSIKQEPISQGVLDTISYEYTAYFSEKNYNNYREDYIVYKDYVLYQGKSDTKRLSPDMATFRGKGKGFAMDKNGIYYRGYFFPMDTTGFRVVGKKDPPERF